MKNTIFILYLFGLVLGTLSCNQKPMYSDAEPFYGSLVYNDSIYSPIPQFQLNRLFEAAAGEEGYRFTIPTGSQGLEADSVMVMSMPTQAVVDKNEQFFYVMDTESYLINKFALSDGSLQKSITTAQEYRKAHNLQPSLQLLSDGSLQICGTERRQILQLHPDGKVKNSVKIPRGVNGCVMGIDSENQVALTIFNFDELFQVLNKRGRIKDNFGVVSNLHLRPVVGDIKYKAGHGIDFVGSIGTDGASSFVYAGSKWGGLLGFDVNGEFRFFRETINHRPLPFRSSLPLLSPIEEGKSGPQIMEFEPEILEDEPADFRFTVNVWEGVYYQQIIPPCNAETCASSFIVDAYSYENGDYLYSLHTPVNCGAIFITEDHIYANCLGRGLVQFVRRSRPSPFA